MKRVLFPSILLAGIVLVTTQALAAQNDQPKPIEKGEILSWLTDPPDWGKGGLLFGLGLVGALVTVFGLIGGAVPGTAGQAKIDADEAELEQLSQRRSELIKAAVPDAASITAIEVSVNNLRDDLRAERWRQFGTAALLYAFLGACFSAILAKDLLQALVIGAGWTSFLGSLGLKRDYSERKVIKDDALRRAEQALAAGPQAQPSSIGGVKSLELDMQRARAI